MYNVFIPAFFNRDTVQDYSKYSMLNVSRTDTGLAVLQTRSPDDRESDWVGNAFDVSIRQLHTLALHLDEYIVRLGECTCVGDSNCNGDRIEDPHCFLYRSIHLPSYSYMYNTVPVQHIS